MKLTHRFAQLTPDKRPQDPKMDGSGLRFETMEHGEEYPDTMPQVIKLVDAEGRSSGHGRRSAIFGRNGTTVTILWAADLQSRVNRAE